MTFSPEKLVDQLEKFPAAEHYWVAFSGGLDSTALLHALCSLGPDWRQRLTAVYIDHNLHSDSAVWQRHCKQLCRQWNVSFHAISVVIDQHRHLGIEGGARQARYQALSALLGPKDALLTAHHRDDQVETVCLQLFRGSGPSGLAAMPVEKPLGLGVHLRPLLTYSRSQLAEYVSKHRLSWIEDPSNQSLQHDRNYLRNKLLPEMRSRWPAIDITIARMARLQAENTSIQNELGQIDYAQCEQLPSDQLAVGCLRRLTEHRQRNLLRYWILLNQFPVPGFKRLQTLQEQALNSSADSQMLIQWAQCEVRKFQQQLYIMPALKAFKSEPVQWRWQQPLQIESLDLVLTTDELIQQLGRQPEEKELTVRFRQGGEFVQLRGRDGTRNLKKVFQECAVPPWQRDRIPLLYEGNRLLLVWGLPCALTS